MPPADGGATADGLVFASMSGIESRSFVVAGGSVYFAADASGPTFQQAVYKASVSGGTPTSILKTTGFDHMAASATTLYVTSGCGLQQIAL